MIRAYSEIVKFRVSDRIKEYKEYIADLIRREKTTGLTTEEASDLDKFLTLEHIMRMAKTR